MFASPFRSARASRAAAALGALAVLSGCVSSAPDTDLSAEPMFRARIGEISGGTAPGPHSVWYVPRQPVSFARTGVAAWRTQPRHPAPAWIARLIGRRSAARPEAEPTAVVAAGLGLPVPSHVEVTNLVTGATVTVRIDHKAPMGGKIIRLSQSAAQGLGAEAGRPLLVDVRYVAPVFAYRARPTLRYALRGPQPAPPVAVARAQVDAPTLSPTPAPVLAAPSPPLREAAVRQAPILPAAPAPVAPQNAGLALRPELSPPRIERAQIRLQVGAFASLANAQRAVEQLKPAGVPAIEPMRRGGLTLYRVTLTAPGGPEAAQHLRARLTQMGFAGAWQIQPL